MIDQFIIEDKHAVPIKSIDKNIFLIIAGNYALFVLLHKFIKKHDMLNLLFIFYIFILIYIENNRESLYNSICSFPIADRRL